MKIVIVDNFNRDYISEQLYAEGVSEKEGQIMVEELNSKHGPASPYYYMLKPDNYKLYEWEP